MRLYFRATLVAAALFVCSGAHAEDAKPAPPAAAPAPAPAPAAPATEPPPALSQSKFLSLLYAEIARLSGDEDVAVDGEVTASFHVDASGKVDKVTIDKTTSPAHAETVKKILAAVKVPPPPGGGMDVGQTFKFHANEE
jgi:hypothetical protein